MKVKLKLKKISRGKNQRKWYVDKLTVNVEAFRRGIENDVHAIEGITVEEKWNTLKGNILKNAKLHVGYRKGKKIKEALGNRSHVTKMRKRRK